LDEPIDEGIEMRVRLSPHSIGTVNCSLYRLLPSQILGTFSEILTESFPKFLSYFFRIMDFFFKMDVIEIN
jgi:hypothetical protein